MSIEQKKLLGAVGSAIAGIATLSGILLMALQIKTHGSGFFVGYLLYALAVLAGGMVITWLPTLKNNKWGFKLIDGGLKWRKDERVTDPNRTRLVWWPLITLFFELYGLFDYGFDLWQKPVYEMLKYLFVGLTLLALFAWCAIIIIEDVCGAKKNL